MVCATAITRCSTSSVTRSATCHETFHDARHRASWCYLLSNLLSPNTCHVRWHVPLPPAVAADTPPPPSVSSQTTRFLVGTSYCAVYYHYHYYSPMHTSLNASTARRHVPPSHVVTSQLRAALATQCAAQSFKFKMWVAKHQACFQRNCKGKTWRRSVILLWHP